MSVRRLVFRWSDDATADRAAADVTVRRACGRDDAAAIAALVEAVRESGFPVTNPAGLLADLTSRPGREVRVWVAERDDTIVGLVATVAAGTNPPRHSIAWLLVSPACRRRRVGSALVAAALAEARARGAREVWVETRADWAAAEALWRALGFRPPVSRSAP